VKGDNHPPQKKKEKEEKEKEKRLGGNKLLQPAKTKGEEEGKK
jgi:hypothetical protein